MSAEIRKVRCRLQPLPLTRDHRHLTPADVYFGRGSAILAERERIKRQAIAYRRHAGSAQLGRSWPGALAKVRAGQALGLSPVLELLWSCAEKVFSPPPTRISLGAFTTAAALR
jgi:hypothetical protein